MPWKQNNTVVEVIRDARLGDKGYNPSKGPQKVIKNPTRGMAGVVVVTEASLVWTEPAVDADQVEPQRRPARRLPKSSPPVPVREKATRKATPGRKKR